MCLRAKLDIDSIYRNSCVLGCLLSYAIIKGYRAPGFLRHPTIEQIVLPAEGGMRHTSGCAIPKGGPPGAPGYLGYGGQTFDKM